MGESSKAGSRTASSLNSKMRILLDVKFILKRFLVSLEMTFCLSTDDGGPVFKLLGFSV